MNRKIVLLPLSVMILGLTACDLGPSGSSEVVTPSSEIITTSEEPGVFDGGIKDIEIGEPVMVHGIVASIVNGKGFTLADALSSVYCYGSLPEGIALGDHINLTGSCENYFGQREVKDFSAVKREDSAELPEAVEISGADVQAYREAIDAAKAEDPIVGVSPEMQKAYKVTGLTTVDIDGYAGFEFDGVATKLVSHYYASKHNRTEENRNTQLYAGCKYDVFFYPSGTSAANNVQMHIYDVVSHYDAVESVTLGDVASAEIAPEGTLRLSATVLPANSDKALIWTSSDTDVATVKDGVVKGVADGNATITVKSAADETKLDTIDITVATPVEPAKVPTIVTEPQVGVKYKAGVNTSKDEGLAENYYLNGQISGNYVATVAGFDSGSDVELEAAADGKFYVKVGDKYMNMVASTKYTNVQFGDTASTAYSFNADTKTLVANVTGHDPASADGEYYLGTYYNSKQGKTFNTLSCSLLTYITGDNLSKVDAGGTTAQYPLHLWVLA